MMKEQDFRNSRSSERVRKFLSDSFTSSTLHDFAMTIQHPRVPVSVIFQIDSPSILEVLPQLNELANSRFQHITDVHLIPYHPSWSVECSTPACLLYSVTLCSSFAMNDRAVIMAFQSCIFSSVLAGEAIENQASVLNTISVCMKQAHIFPPSVNTCLQSPDSLLLLHQNNTASMMEIIRNIEDEQIITSLASLALLEDDEDDEDNEDGDKVMDIDMEMKKKGGGNRQVPKMEIMVDSDASMHDLSSDDMQILHALLPLAILVNHRLADRSLPLTQQVCKTVSDNTTPLPCGDVKEIKPERFSPTPLELKVYLQANCKSNAAALDDLFTWFSQYPE